MKHFKYLLIAVLLMATTIVVAQQARQLIDQKAPNAKLRHEKVAITKPALVKFKTEPGTNVVKYPVGKYNMMSEAEQVTLKKEIEAEGLILEMDKTAANAGKVKSMTKKKANASSFKQTKRSRMASPLIKPNYSSSSN